MSPSETVRSESVDVRLLALVRCGLAAAALVALLLGALDPGRLEFVTYGLMVTYASYSVALAALAFRGVELVPQPHWLDIFFYVSLLALTEGASSLFFLLFLFAILLASLSHGFRESLAVTLASVALLAGVELLSYGGTDFEIERAVITPLGLLLLGWLIAWWGGREMTGRRRLRLLKEVASAGNARVGVDNAVVQHLRRLITYFGAQSCVLVCARRSETDYVVYRVEDGPPGASYAPRPLTGQATQALLALPAGATLAWSDKQPNGDAAVEEACRRLANLLETTCFASVPYQPQERPPGRLFLLAGAGCENEDETAFLREVVEHMAAPIDNLMLLEELTTNATQLERTRISRDIHDTALQPYIGLKLGLEALLRKLEPDSVAASQVKELLSMSALAAGGVRGYMAQLRGSAQGSGGNHLAEVLRQHTAQYRTFYGIDVEMRCDEAVQVSERVAGEVYQIVNEALSNVYRHTDAKRAFVELRCQADSLAIAVGNERAAGAKGGDFTPRSIAERAKALGGTLAVHAREGTDVIEVTVPL